ncbi:IS3 family transposase [Candidatus Symbiobacter mobilis]
MTRYSLEFQEQIARKMMPPNSQSIAKISQETGVSAPTLYAWRNRYRSQGHVVPAKPEDPQGWDWKAKAAAVLKTVAMNEAEKAEYCRQNGLHPEHLQAWEQVFEEADSIRGPVNAGDIGAERKKVRHLEKELKRKDKALAEAAALLVLSKKGPGHLGQQRGRLITSELKQMAIDLIKEACQQGARESKACAVLEITCRTLRRWREQLRKEGVLSDRRMEAAQERIHPQALTAEEKQEVLDVCNSAEFGSLPPSQIVPILADRGRYLASESTFYRVLREAGQCNRRGRARAPKQTQRPQAWEASSPNRVWTWDITYMPTLVKGEFYRLYMAVDVYSRKIMGWEVHCEETAQHAAILIEKACMVHEITREQLVLHSDNGSPMKGVTMLGMLQKLGVVPSFSRPSVSDDNPYSESLFRTMKYCPKYPAKPFGTLDQAREWVLGFVTWYNNEHRHSGIRFVTPEQRHRRMDQELLATRSRVYEQAKAARPQRWKSRAVRNWSPVGTVWLNPTKEHRALLKSESA